MPNLPHVPPEDRERITEGGPEQQTRIKIITYADGSKEFIPQYKTWYGWTSYDSPNSRLKIIRGYKIPYVCKSLDDAKLFINNERLVELNQKPVYSTVEYV